jgi:hypothetical protein
MSTLTEARQVLADAVTGAGLPCEPYPPDNTIAPAAFVDRMTVDYTGGGASFCAPGVAEATIVTLAQRHDRAESTEYLEGLLVPVAAALAAAGARVTGAASGSTAIAGHDVPALIYTVQFPTG